MQRSGEILLATAYLGPVQYFSRMLQAERTRIEKHENYTKQTYRNRCLIAGANGVQALSIPVKRGSFHKVHVKDLEIEYGKNWQNVHWRAITAAYRSSPYFEFYQDLLRPFFEKQIRFLMDFNTETSMVLLEEICPGIRPVYTESFLPPGSTGHIQDFRASLVPGNVLPGFHPLPYPQVFSDRHGFIPDLSIIDLLFNLGPETAAYLENCMKELRI